MGNSTGQFPDCLQLLRVLKVAFEILMLRHIPENLDHLEDIALVVLYRYDPQLQGFFGWILQKSHFRQPGTKTGLNRAYLAGYFKIMEHLMAVSTDYLLGIQACQGRHGPVHP